MVVKSRRTDQNSLELTIIATGDPGDNVNLPSGLTHLPYNGPYTIDWGDQTPLQVVPQPVDAVGPPATSKDDPVVVTHDYALKGSFRGYVEGDARIRFNSGPIS